MKTIEQRSDFVQLNFFHVVARTQMSMELQDCVKILNDEVSSVEQKYEALTFISENKPFYDMLCQFNVIIETKYLRDWYIENIIGHNYCNEYLHYLCNLFYPITRFEQFKSFECDDYVISLLQIEKLIHLVLSHDENELSEVLKAKPIELTQNTLYFEHNFVKNMLLDFKRAIQRLPVAEKTLDNYLAKYREWCVKHNAIGFTHQYG